MVSGCKSLACWKKAVYGNCSCLFMVSGVSILMRLFLIQNRIDIIASQDNKYEFIIDIASGTLKFEGIVSWLTNNTAKLNDR